VVGSAFRVITTSSVDGVHPPFEIVHLNVTVPTTSPVTAEVGLEGVVTEPVPAITVHAPVPKEGVFAASVAEEAQTV
jgi:hypothetical protein